MSPFNPNIPNQDVPNYFGYSQPISQPEPDKTLSSAISGVGNLLDQGVKAVDFFIKDNIKGKVDAATDTIGGIFTAGLEATAGRDTEGTLVGSPDTSAPFDVRNAGGSAGMLRSAAEAGKLSPTSYYGKLTQLAKDLRAQHPGYRDYIDQQISQATGIHPANAYIRSLMTDINAGQAKANSEYERQQKYILEKAPELYKAIYVDRTLDPQTGMVKASERAAQTEEINRNKATAADDTANREVRDKNARDEATKSSSYLAKNFVEDMIIDLGMGGKKTMAQINTGIANGTLNIDSTTAATLLPQIYAKKAEYVRQATADFNKGGDKSVNMRLKNGAEDGNKIIAANGALFDELAKNIGEGKGGLAMYSATLATSRINDAQLGLLESKEVGFQTTQTAALRKIAGDQYIQEFSKYLMKTNFDEKYKVYYNDNMAKFVHQSDLKKQGDGTFVAAPLPVPFTIRDAVDEGLKKGINDSRLYNNYVNYVSSLSDPQLSDPAKINLIRAGYSPQNQGLLSRFQPDGIDPSTKQPIVGQDSVFAQLTKLDNLKTIKEMSDKYDKTLWPMAKGFAETEFSNELFKRDVQKLNSIQDNPNFKMFWDTKSHGWGVSPISQGVLMKDSGLDAHRKEVQSILTRINNGIQTIKNIAVVEGSGEDAADAYAIGLVGQAGFNLKETMPGLPSKLVDAIKAAHADPTFVERILGKSNERVPQNQPVVNK